MRDDDTLQDYQDYADYAIDTAPAPVKTPSRPLRPTIGSRTITLWVTMAICVALLVATAGEVWARISVERQVAQTQSQNARIRQDIHTTQQQVTQANSPATIEREARAWGYVRPGETPVIIAPTPKP